MQDPSRAKGSGKTSSGSFDMRDWLDPRRVTVIMWDHAFLTRHMKGDSFEDYDKVLSEAAERGYNTLRLDPMPQVIALDRPETVLTRPPTVSKPELFPWERAQAFEGPAGVWLIEFMEKVLQKGFCYCLSAWNGKWETGAKPENLHELTNRWIPFLHKWRERFGFEKCLYVDLSNEYPYFLNGHLKRTIREYNGRWSPEWNEFIKQEVNGCLKEMRREFPEVRFMVSLHGDVRWIDLDLELDVMDVHFYSDADPRFTGRTLFDKHVPELFTTDAFFKGFSDRCVASHKIMAPMYRAQQRSKLAAFSAWSGEYGIPLTTSESWASWYYLDHKDLDWSWLLEWAEWSVEDAIEYGMWGWTPHNYCQPQFANWKDVKWHRKLTDKFLKS